MVKYFLVAILLCGFGFVDSAEAGRCGRAGKSRACARADGRGPARAIIRGAGRAAKWVVSPKRRRARGC